MVSRRRSGITRNKPLDRKTGPKRRAIPRSGHTRDPVTGALYDDVMARDGHHCVGPRVGFGGLCQGPLELDHVLNAGHGRRGPSTRSNLVVLCRAHHRYKTEHANVCRPPLVEWIHDLAGVRSRQP